MNSEIMHPTTELLTDYLDSPESADFYDIRKHLVNCGNCRHEIIKLSQFKSRLIDELPKLNGDASDSDPQLREAIQSATIEAYVDDALDPEQRNNIGYLLKSNKTALKAALHYASHSAAMPRDMTQDKKSYQEFSHSAEQVNKQSYFMRILKGIYTKRSSNWFSVPLTAFAVLMLTVSILPHLSITDSGARHVATYQDEKVLRFNKTQTSPPGIGFFNSAVEIQAPFENVRLSMTKQQLQVEWPEVADAKNYTFTVYEIQDGQKHEISSTTTDSTRLDLGKPELNVAQRYEWKLSGTTKNQLNFSVSGGFIISN